MRTERAYRRAQDVLEWPTLVLSLAFVPADQRDAERTGSHAIPPE